jgi:cyanuric acid amidohydrolase
MTSRRAAVHRFAITNPGDVSTVALAIDAGVFDPIHVVAAIGKTPGNGLVNDYTRGFLTLMLADLLAARGGGDRSDIIARTPFVFSGGVEGVLTPHVSLFCVEPADDVKLGRSPARLAIGTAISRPLTVEEIGTDAQIALAAETVDCAIQNAGIDDRASVHFVQIKAPCFSAETIAAAKASGRPTRTESPSTLMAYSRAASAFGVARALGELPSSRLSEAGLLRDFDVFSSVASTSAGVEIKSLEVVALGLSPKWSGDLIIAHRTLRDALDIAGFGGVAADVGLPARPQVSAAGRQRIAAVLVKCEPSRDGMIRGQPHTMLNDGDIDAQRHIRAAVGALAAGVFGDTRIFVSGGAEHQGPDGGGLVAVVARVGEDSLRA